MSAATPLERLSTKPTRLVIAIVLARRVECDRNVRREAQLCRGGAALVKRLIHADPA
jgi:hypothetical protein